MGYGLTIRVAVAVIVVGSIAATAARHCEGMSGQHGGDDPSESRELHFDFLRLLKVNRIAPGNERFELPLGAEVKGMNSLLS